MGKKLWKRAFGLIIAGVTMMCVSSCEDRNFRSGKTPEEQLRSAVSVQKLVSGEPVCVATSPVYTNQAIRVQAPENVLEAQPTGKTGETLTVSKDERYGGGQFIEKLFTEGLSRAAYGEEYALFQDYLVENGCKTETLATLAKAVFTSQTFEALGLNRAEKLFCVYRAVLSRDPSPEEVYNTALNDVSALVDELCAGEEFASMMEGIRSGPYFWRGNNTELWTGERVFTTEEFLGLFDGAADKTVELPQGSLVLVDRPIAIPEGYTVRTEGNPDHYIKYSRFLRIGSRAFDMMTVVDNSCIQNFFCDGNRTGVGKGKGHNILFVGNHIVGWGCRSSDSTSNTHFCNGFSTVSSRIYFGNNLITAYATAHTGDTTWADGINISAADSIVENNHIVDATDAGIVAFRTLSNLRGGALNTIIRYNLVCNTGNSCYCGLDNEGVDLVGSGVADFTGTVFYENAVYTSYLAHMHLCLTLSARPWTEQYKKVANNSAYNNYSPKGCFVNTAGGIVIEGVNNGTVHGNQFKFHLGDWTTNFLGKRYYSVNTDSCRGGDFQSGHQNWSATNFISPVMDIEKEASFEVEVAYVYENFREIPADKFLWGEE